jgi:hypothetical protein
MADPARDQQQKEAAHVAPIIVTPRGDEKVHLIEFQRATSEAATSTEELLFRSSRRLFTLCCAKKTIAKTPNPVSRHKTAHSVRITRSSKKRVPGN